MVNLYYKKKASINIKYIDDFTKREIDGVSEDNDNTVHYGDTYNVQAKKDAKEKDSKFANYTYDRFDVDGVTSGDLNGVLINKDSTVVSLYYKKKATINIEYIDEITKQKISTDEKIDTNYGIEYSSLNLDSKRKTIDGYDYSKTETNPSNITGSISQDTTTITHYYKKKASIIINYIDKHTGTSIPGINQDKIDTHYGESYDTENNRREKEINPLFENYEYTNEYTVEPNVSLSGTMNYDSIVVNYYYNKRTTITIKYIDKNTSQEISKEEIYNHYDDSYNTENNRIEKEKDSIFNDYEYANEYKVNKDVPLKGTMSVDSFEVEYYYNKKATITIKYYDIETKKEISSASIDDKVYYGHIYDVDSKKIEKEKEEIFKNYNFEKYESNSGQKDNLKQIKIDNSNVTVDLYYRLKESTLTIKYLEEKTNKELVETYTKTMKYKEEYDAPKIRNKAGVPKDYNLVRYESSTDALTGTISEPSILIVFYYEKKDPKIDEKISKTGTKEITKKNQKVEYKINYKATIKDYIGTAIVTYTDKLPYEIDEENSELSGGKYNKEEKTITWVVSYDKIDMEKEIEFNKEISLVYVGIDDSDRIMTNIIEAKIKLNDKEQTITNDYNTDINIPGEIIIHYYDKETNKKISDDIVKKDLIGTQFVSDEKEFEGYKLVNKPESNIHIFKEKKQEFNYEYEKIKFKITTKVDGEGGTIEGDEIVKYGEDSSKDKIIIKALDGYEINKITINGENYEITDTQKIVMPYFKNVKEDKEIVVSFNKKITNPKTLDNVMSYIIYSIVSLIGIVISIVVLIKNKTQKN